MRARIGFIGAVAAVALGCGPSDPGAPDGGADGGQTAVTCENDPRVSVVAAGSEARSSDGSLHVSLVKLDPASPVRGNNAWTVRFADASGHAVTPSSVDVEPFMPDHGHGSSVKPSSSANADGSWTVSPLYLFMPGVWQVVFHVVPAEGAAAQTATFALCVAG